MEKDFRFASKQPVGTCPVKQRISLKNRLLLPLLILIPTLLLLHPLSLAGKSIGPRDPSPEPVFRIPLRVHLGKSRRPPKEWRPILEEINLIWLSQAGICFEIHTVLHDEKLLEGLDIWFEATIPDWNGYYRGEHDIHVRDNPDLRPARRPAETSAARTAAHELGHALKLSHNQSSDDNLMRSKTYGWQLHANEIETARQNARQIALADLTIKQCSPVRINNN